MAGDDANGSAAQPSTESILDPTHTVHWVAPGLGTSRNDDPTEEPFLASIGIRMLINGARTLRQSCHKLVRVGPQSPVGEVLENSGPRQIVPISGDERAALQLLAR